MNADYRAVTLTGGFWKQKEDLNRDVSLPAVYDRFSETGRIGAFRFDWKEGMPDKPHIYWDSDVFKWLEGAAYVLFREKDPDLMSRAEALVDQVVKNQGEDGYFNTHTEMSAYKKFITDELPQQFEGVSKADQADMLNRCSNYFKQNDNFDLQSFTQEVIAQPEVIDSFKEYREQYQQENDVQMPESYDINESAVKKQSRAYKSVIKLDKNFHIYVHGNRELIEQGEDEKGKYYKVYYSEES